MPRPAKKAKLTLEERINLFDPTFIDSVNGLNTDALRIKYAEVAKNEEANQSAKKADGDLAAKKDAVKAASSGYSEITQRNKLRSKFLIRMLSDSGDAVAATIIQNDAEAEALKG